MSGPRSSAAEELQLLAPDGARGRVRKPAPLSPAGRADFPVRPRAPQAREGVAGPRTAHPQDTVFRVGRDVDRRQSQEAGCVRRWRLWAGWKTRPPGVAAVLLVLLGLLVSAPSLRAQDTYEAYSPVVSYVFEENLDSEEVFSPVVSYVFEESLASADAYSPVVSYVFMEALPDDVTSEFTSAPVSYFGSSGKLVFGTVSFRSVAG